MTKSKKM